MYRAIAKNKRNTVFIILLFILIIGGLAALAAWIYQDVTIVIITLAISIGYALIQYFAASSQALALSGAHQIQKADNPRLYRIVENLSITTGTPMPKVYIIDEAQPNAFATGRDPEHAAVAATTGIMRILTERELRGVMAHELARVKHRDTLISTISATMAGAISSIAQFGMLFTGGHRDRNVHPLVAIAIMILAPIAAMLIQMAISRAREFEADKGGAEISRDPTALAAALRKIHDYAHQIPLETAEAHPETAQMMIINPLSGGGISGLFSTHPQTEERVARLMAMAV